MAFGKKDLLDYMLSARLAVVSTLGSDGAPQSALVGIGTTDDHRIVFDTLSTTRKHANLVRDRRAAIVIAGPGEKTVQIEGLAAPVPADAGGAVLRDAYYRAWPDGRDRAAWPGLVHWRIDPLWARYCDYDSGPLIAEFVWAERGPA